MMAGPTTAYPQFGALLGSYRGGGLARILHIAGAVILFALGLVLLVAGTGSQGTGGMIALILVGVVFFGLSGFLVWRVIASFGTTIALYEGGFSVTRGGRTTHAVWSDVNSIRQAILRQTYYGIPVWTSYTYRLALNSGETFKFTEMLGSIRQMGEIMQRQITAALTPRVLQALRSGQPSVPFGKLSLTPYGVANGAEVLPWNEINNVSIASGSLFIYKVGKKLRWASASMAKTPNAYVFLSAINVMRRGAGQPAPQAQP